MGSSTHNCYYNTLYRHFQVSIIKNNTYFFWVKTKNIYIIFSVLLKRKSVLFFSNRGLGIIPQKYFSSIFSKEKNLKKGYVDVHIRCLLSHFIFFMPFSFFQKTPLDKCSKTTNKEHFWLSANFLCRIEKLQTI